MEFDFQKRKSIIQENFDRILDKEPADMGDIIAHTPVGGDPYVRKLAIIEKAARECPTKIFEQYPFAFEIDFGEKREICYVGVGKQCYLKSGVDMSPLQQLRMDLDKWNLGKFNNYTDFLHRTLDHDKLLAVGFRGVYEECLAANSVERDTAKKIYREMVMRTCLAVKLMGERLRRHAKEMLPTASDEEARYNLQRIADSVNTPWEAPVTFFDGLNTILCTTLWISSLDGVEMNAYGSVDRLLYPFYRKDLEKGILTKEEAFYLLQCFLYKTDFHVHYNEERKAYDNGVSIMIGGCDLQGNPVYNAVTDMIIDAYRDNKLINPKLNARASAKSPRPYLERLAELVMSGNNNLVVENDDYIIPMFVRMGLSEEDARTYVGNGCQEVICRNQLHSRAFVYINMVQILKDTLYYGKRPGLTDERKQKMYLYGDARTGTFEEVLDSFLLNLRSYIRVLAEHFIPYEKMHAQMNPEPMLSAFTADCMKKGLDITEGGALYYHKTLSLVGFGTLCDSLLALREAFEKGSMQTLIDAAERDFADQEVLQLTLQNSKNKFGHSEKADAFAAELAQKLGNVSEGIQNADGITWRTSLFTYYTYRWFGSRMGATPDGRKAGEALSRQMNMAVVPELTAAARAMSALSEANFNDVGMFDIALPLSASEKVSGALTDYIRTCMEFKIPVLQTNTIDKEALIEEREHKGTHPDLVVRICGYSAIFGELSKEMQTEVINRLQV